MKYFEKRKIKKANRELINKIYRCKTELDKWSDIPINWQLEKLAEIWEEKSVIMSFNGRPQTIFKDFIIQIQMCRDVEKFAKSLPEWQKI